VTKEIASSKGRKRNVTKKEMKGREDKEQMERMAMIRSNEEARGSRNGNRVGGSKKRNKL
jgi:hypothetical protein